jgi:peptidoglycan/LPS O-acetylase OafA/YrhL
MGRILGLDGIRAYAAITVVLLHLQLFIHWYYEESPLYSLIRHGVEIFFVLSGYLITHLLLLEKKHFGDIDLKKFWARRFLRIFPLFYLFIFSVILVSILFETETSLKQIFISAIYGFNFIPRSDYSILLAHTSTLAIEEHFYIIWPPVLILMLKKSASLEKILLFLISFFIILEVFNNHLIFQTKLGTEYFVERWTTSAAVYLLTGCIGAVLTHTKVWKRWNSSWGLSIILVILFACGFFVEFWYSGHPIILRDFRMVGILSGILWIICNQNSILVRFLEWAPLSYLGKVSYGIYIWQGFYLATEPRRAVGQDWPLSDPYIAVLLLSITVPISYHLFEKRFLKLKQNYRRSSTPLENE